MQGRVVDQRLRELPDRLLGACPQTVLAVFLTVLIMKLVHYPHAPLLHRIHVSLTSAIRHG